MMFILRHKDAMVRALTIVTLFCLTAMIAPATAEGALTTPQPARAEVAGMKNPGNDLLPAQEIKTLSRPPRPLLKSPAKNANVAGRAITFRWRRSTGATKYQLQVIRVSDNRAFMKRTLNNVLTFRCGGFPNDGTQFNWRIRAGNASGWGPWSAFRRFTNGGAAPQPQWHYHSWNKSFGRIIYTGYSNTIVAVEYRGSFLSDSNIFQSTDAGVTWNEKVSWVGTINALHFCPAPRDTWHTITSRNVTGYAVGGAEGFGVSMYIGKTLDGGETWEDQSDNFRASLNTDNVAIRGVAVLTPDIIVINCRDNIYKTYDGGSTWAKVGNIYNLKPDVGRWLHHTLQFLPAVGAAPEDIPVHGFVSSADSLFVTSDGGNHWQRIDPPWNQSGMQLVRLQFLNNRDGFAMLQVNIAGFNGRQLIRTTSGGETWTIVKSWNALDGINPQTFYAHDQSIIWMGSWYDEIWYSSNGGADWELKHRDGSWPGRRIWSFSPPLPGSNIVAWTSSGSAGVSIYGYYRHQ